MFEKWLETIEKKYMVDITVIDGGNYFISKIYNITDPSNKGLGFTVSVDDKGLPTVFNTSSFQFAHFNVAEYVKSEDILAAAECCLNGELKFKKTIFGNKYKLRFDLPTFDGYSTAVGINDSKPSYLAYRKK